jgi:hypothetical protein
VVLCGSQGVRPEMPRAEAIARVRAMPSVSSAQITFDPAKPPAEHAMPPGGFRLAIVNSWERVSGNAARVQLRAVFWSAVTLDFRACSGGALLEHAKIPSQCCRC